MALGRNTTHVALPPAMVRHIRRRTLHHRLAPAWLEPVGHVLLGVQRVLRAAGLGGLEVRSKALEGQDHPARDSGGDHNARAANPTQDLDLMGMDSPISVNADLGSFDAGTGNDWDSAISDSGDNNSW